VRGSSLSLDQRATRMIERAEEEARRLKDEYVSTEHLLLAAPRSAATPSGSSSRPVPVGRRYSRRSRCARRSARDEPEPRGHVPVPRALRP
jgi:ATP-dependent Clp protease ATP-binding subunit ClpB